MTNPTPLSPAAQAVLDAVEDHGKFSYKKLAAAALVAAADYAHRSSYVTSPPTDRGDSWAAGVRDTARGLLAIAAELEGAR